MDTKEAPPPYSFQIARGSENFLFGESSADVGGTSARKSYTHTAVAQGRRRMLIIAAVAVVLVLVGVLAALGGLGKFSSSSSGGSSAPSFSSSSLRVYIVGNITDSATGAPLGGVTLTAGQDTFVTGANGSYAMWTTAISGRFTVQLNKSGYAPQVGAGSVSGAPSYALPLAMTKIQEQLSFLPSKGINFTFALNMSDAIVYIPPNATNRTGPVYLRLAELQTGSGPGSLAIGTQNAQYGSGLQSAGMFYMEVVDAAGVVLTLSPPAQISFVYHLTGNASLISGDPMHAWEMDVGAGLWANPNAQAVRRRDSTTELGYSEAASAGFWNADRAYRTGCVRLKAVTNTGAVSAGARMSLESFGIVSEANTDANGAVCLNGPAGATAYISNSFTYLKFVRLGPTAGTCNTPTLCADIGSVTVSNDATPPLPPAPPTQAPAYTAFPPDYWTTYCNNIQQQLQPYLTLYPPNTPGLISCCIGFRFSYNGVNMDCKANYPWSSYAGTCATYVSSLQQAVARVPAIGFAYSWMLVYMPSLRSSYF